MWGGHVGLIGGGGLGIMCPVIYLKILNMILCDYKMIKE